MNTATAKKIISMLEEPPRVIDAVAGDGTTLLEFLKFDKTAVGLEENKQQYIKLSNSVKAVGHFSADLQQVAYKDFLDKIGNGVFNIIYFDSPDYDFLGYVDRFQIVVLKSDKRWSPAKTQEKLVGKIITTISNFSYNIHVIHPR